MVTMRIGCPVAHGMGTTHVIVNRSKVKPLGALANVIEAAHEFVTVEVDDQEEQKPRPTLSEIFGMYFKPKVYYSNDYYRNVGLA